MSTPPGETLTDVLIGVARLEGKVDLIARATSGTERSVADHETRIRKLEEARWPLRSIATVCGIAAVLVPVLMELHH